MVHWCKKCGALIGLREPIDNWSVERNSICCLCAASLPTASTEIELAVAEIVEDPIPTDIKQKSLQPAQIAIGEI